MRFTTPLSNLPTWLPGVSGAEFVRLGDGRLRELAAPGELPRVLRVLRAHEAFADIDGCGEQGWLASSLPCLHPSMTCSREGDHPRWHC